MSERLAAGSGGDPGFDVFISHNSQDKPAVRALCHALQARGSASGWTRTNSDPACRGKRGWRAVSARRARWACWWVPTDSAPGKSRRCRRR